jgi:hypothetical protein
MSNNVSNIIEALFGTVSARKEFNKTKQSPPSISDGIAEFNARNSGPGVTSDASPIFIFSAGWRSGSTLVQRLINSSGRALIWGEPYHHSGLIERLATSLRSLTPTWPSRENFIDADRTEDIAERWTANLYPDLNDLKASHIEFFDRLLASPAKTHGFDRWGMKVVWLDIEHARYLKWLYPNSKFVFLYRNPLSAYASYRGRGDRNWYITWPEQPVFTPKEFGKLWTSILTGYLQGAAGVGGVMLRFEDLVGGAIGIDGLNQLSDYLGTPIDGSVLKKKIGSSKAYGRKEIWVPRVDRFMLKQQVRALARELGYVL